MKIRLIYKVIPVFIFYIPWYWGHWVGVTIASFIFMNREYRDQVDYLEHEIIHAKQWWQFPIGMWVFWFFHKPSRLEYEVEAYAHQARFTPHPYDSLAKYAIILHQKYSIDQKEDKILKLLKREYNWEANI